MRVAGNNWLYYSYALSYSHSRNAVDEPNIELSDSLLQARGSLIENPGYIKYKLWKCLEIYHFISLYRPVLTELRI